MKCKHNLAPCSLCHAKTGELMPGSQRESAVNELVSCNDEFLLKECYETLSHAEVFIESRQKMHPTELDSYKDLIQKLEIRLSS